MPAAWADRDTQLPPSVTREAANSGAGTVASATAVGLGVPGGPGAAIRTVTVTVPVNLRPPVGASGDSEPGPPRHRRPGPADGATGRAGPGPALTPDQWSTPGSGPTAGRSTGTTELQISGPGLRSVTPRLQARAGSESVSPGRSARQLEYPSSPRARWVVCPLPGPHPRARPECYIPGPRRRGGPGFEKREKEAVSPLHGS